MECTPPEKPVRERRKHTPEFKASAVRLARQPHAKVSQIARDLGVGDTLLRNWIKAADVAARRGLNEEERLELAWLRDQNRTLRENQAIPKKGSAPRPARRRWDNAPAESVFSTLKHECLDPSCVKRIEAVTDTDPFITGYNAHRLQSTLGYRSPMSFEARHSRGAA